MWFPRQEYWSGLPFPSPGDFPNPGTESAPPAWQADPFTTEPPEKHSVCTWGGQGGGWGVVVHVWLCISHFLYPCIYQWTLILCSNFSYCEKCYNEYEKTNLFQILISILLAIYPEAELLKHMISCIFNFFEKPPLFSYWLQHFTFHKLAQFSIFFTSSPTLVFSYFLIMVVLTVTRWHLTMRWQLTMVLQNRIVIKTDIEIKWNI